MPALTDAELKTQLAAVLRKPAGPSALAAHFDVIVAAANANAKDDINAALVQRGYLLATALTWDSYGKFNRDIGLYYCGQSGMAEFTTAEGALLKAFDRRGELKDAPFTVAGVLVDPDADAEGVTTGIGHGSMNSDNRLFGRDAFDAMLLRAKGESS